MSSKCIICAIPKFETIQRNGKFKKYLNMNERYINNYKCIISGKSLFYEESNVDYENNKKTQQNILTYFHGDFNYSKKIILILLKLEKLKFKITFYKGIYIYKKSNINNLAKYIYIKRYIYDSLSNNTIKKIAEVYKMSKLRYPDINDKSLYVQLFFSYYVQSLISEVELKYGIDLTLDFSNFNELYLFLKSKGYVDTYYKTEVKKIKEYIKIVDKQLIKDKIKINNLKIKIEKQAAYFDLGLNIKKLPYSNEKIKLIKEELEKIKVKK